VTAPLPPRRSLLVGAIALVALVSCKSKAVAPGECAYDSDCGESQVCQEEVCVTVSCVASTDCDIGQYCDDTYNCSSGCSADSDCLAGETCDLDSNSCEAYGCRDTQLDCSYGQYCDVATGTCYDADAPLCEECIVNGDCGGLGNECLPTEYTGINCDAAERNSCSDPGMECYIVEASEDPCQNDNQCELGWYCDNIGTGTGKVCHRDECITSTCTMTCDATGDGTDCPRGFQCYDAYGNGQGYCLGECAWMADKGYLSSN